MHVFYTRKEQFSNGFFLVEKRYITYMCLPITLCIFLKNSLHAACEISIFFSFANAVTKALFYLSEAHRLSILLLKCGTRKVVQWEVPNSLFLTFQCDKLSFRSCRFFSLFPNHQKS